ncbi:SMP-30/gluconolactonase/LRE family protein [Halomonas sp. MCCC 1A17488]|nr:MULTISPECIES: SMP-30/gluconolactonase/LRE family protein [Halomonas]MCE8016936.1 SMP-30/gluconolactonase/LRE family protein [Halomonas sp. MCCC 1A17488]MCG3240269.1 SMP-30/gluconolactonase/LRE family protein [Halomonas sp. MCCC 1A17488]QPP51480.1 SMP-30/gluconolactonase/LRE family protein [Halomonas sp. SS10-MC5]
MHDDTQPEPVDMPPFARLSRRRFLGAAAAASATAVLKPGELLARERPWDGSLVSYPDPAIEVLDDRFAAYRLANAAVERLATGFRWAEGPVYFGDGGYLVWSDIPNNRHMRWLEDTGEVSVFREPSNFTNGNTRDREGRLLSCEHDTRRVTRTEHDGSITVLAEEFDGKPLNAPNDIIVHPDGGIWFTDPGYGILMHYEGHVADFELPEAVYRIDPDSGQLDKMAEVAKPNGIAFSPDYSRLYVSDTGGTHTPDHPHQILVWDVVDDGTRLANERQFAEVGPGFIDGMAADMDGNLWCGAVFGGLFDAEDHDGVHVYADDGTLIGKIHLPEPCANVCFGGRRRNRLFMTASQSLYAVYVETQGMAVWAGNT